MAKDNLPQRVRSQYGTWMVELNDERVYEDTNKATVDAVITFLNRNRAYGFKKALVSFVNEFKGNT